MTLFHTELNNTIYECAEVYFTDPKYSRTRELHMVANYISSPFLLKEWVVAFNSNLESKGEVDPRKITEWITHFKNWLKFYDCTISPPKEEKNIATAKNTIPHAETETQRRERLLKQQYERNANARQNTTTGN